MLGSITEIWTEVMTWITTSLGSVQTVFYASGELTFLGTLAVVGVSIAIGFLIIGVVQNFLKLRS
jgi:hypothetical protein